MAIYQSKLILNTSARPESWIWLSKKQVVVDSESTFIKPSGLKYYSRMSEDSDSTSNLEMGPVDSKDSLVAQ